MTYRRKFFLISFCMILVAFSASASEPPKGFRGFSWGAHVNRSLKKFGSTTSDGLSMYVPAKGKSAGPFLGVPVVEESYQFSNGKFYCGSAFIDGADNLAKMRAALSEQFGQPSFVNEALGVWKWKWEERKIFVMLSYQQRFARTTVVFENDGI